MIENHGAVCRERKMQVAGQGLGGNVEGVSGRNARDEGY
jgi:hypothetical protein